MTNIWLKQTARNSVSTSHELVCHALNPGNDISIWCPKLIQIHSIVNNASNKIGPAENSHSSFCGLDDLWNCICTALWLSRITPGIEDRTMANPELMTSARSVKAPTDWARTCTCYCAVTHIRFIEASELLKDSSFALLSLDSVSSLIVTSYTKWYQMLFSTSLWRDLVHDLFTIDQFIIDSPPPSPTPPSFSTGHHDQ